MFNCQGGGWCPITRRNKSASECSHSVSGLASPKDVEWSSGSNPICIKGVDLFAVYMLKADKLNLMKWSETVELGLEPFSFELFTISPVTTMLANKKQIQFAPIGLVNMLNSGGSIQSLEFEKNVVRIGVRGHGDFRVFASEKPVGCKIDGVDVVFGYEDSVIRVQVAWNNSSRLSLMEYLF